MRKSNLLILLLILVFAITGYAREKFFTDINLILAQKHFNTSYPLPIAFYMSAFENMEVTTLVIFKYAFTAFFTLTFFLIGTYALGKITGDKGLQRIYLISYLIVMMLAVLSILAGYVLNNKVVDGEYTLSRWLMGIAQSPIICLILLASHKLAKSTQK
jgi:hypothetical protein